MCLDFHRSRIGLILHRRIGDPRIDASNAAAPRLVGLVFREEIHPYARVVSRREAVVGNIDPKVPPRSGIHPAAILAEALDKQVARDPAISVVIKAVGYIVISETRSAIAETL